MLIPHLHFCGNCEEAIAVYEKAFHTKAESIVYSRDYAPGEYSDDSNRIAHAVMNIHGQKVFLNDRFGNRDRSLEDLLKLLILPDRKRFPTNSVAVFSNHGSGFPEVTLLLLQQIIKGYSAHTILIFSASCPISFINLFSCH